MGGVRADAVILFPVVLDRIADEGSASDLRPVSCTLELMSADYTDQNLCNLWVKTQAAAQTITLNHILEFGTSLRRNPLIQAMDTFNQFFEMAIALDQTPLKGGQKSKPTELAKIKSQVVSFADLLKAGETVDL